MEQLRLEIDKFSALRVVYEDAVKALRTDVRRMFPDENSTLEAAIAERLARNVASDTSVTLPEVALKEEFKSAVVKEIVSQSPQLTLTRSIRTKDLFCLRDHVTAQEAYNNSISVKVVREERLNSLDSVSSGSFKVVDSVGEEPDSSTDVLDSPKPICGVTNKTNNVKGDEPRGDIKKEDSKSHDQKPRAGTRPDRDKSRRRSRSRSPRRRRTRSRSPIRRRERSRSPLRRRRSRSRSPYRRQRRSRSPRGRRSRSRSQERKYFPKNRSRSRSPRRYAPGCRPQSRQADNRRDDKRPYSPLRDSNKRKLTPSSPREMGGGWQAKTSTRSWEQNPVQRDRSESRNDVIAQPVQHQLAAFGKNIYVPKVGNPRTLNDSCTVNSNSTEEALNDFFYDNGSSFKPVPSVVPVRANAAGQMDPRTAGVFANRAVYQTGTQNSTPPASYSQHRTMQAIQADKTPNYANPSLATPNQPPRAINMNSYSRHPSQYQPNHSRLPTSNRQQPLRQPQPRREMMNSNISYHAPGHSGLPIQPMGALNMYQTNPPASFDDDDWSIPSVVSNQAASPETNEPTEHQKKVAADALFVLNNLKKQPKPLLPLKKAPEKTMKIPKKKCMVCKIVLPNCKGDKIALCDHCSSRPVASTSTAAVSTASGARKKKTPPVFLISSDDESHGGVSPETDIAIRAGLERKKQNVVKRIKISASDADYRPQLKKRFQSRNAKVSANRAVNAHTTIRGANSGLYGHKVKPLPRPEPSMKRSKEDPVHPNTYASAISGRFPTEDELQFEEFHGTTKCANENCGKPLLKKNVEFILCEDCAIWRHQYCVDKYDFYDSQFSGNCVYCIQMDKGTGQKCIKMDKSAVEIPEPDDADPDEPKGPTEKWKLYWNLFKNSHNIKVGDVVYIKNSTDFASEVDLFWIFYCLRDALNEPYVQGIKIKLPQEIKRFKMQDFYQQEVFPTSENDLLCVPLTEVVGLATLLYRKEFFIGRPRGFGKKIGEDDTYLYEFFYDEEKENHFKAKSGKNGPLVFNYFELNKKKYAWKNFLKPYPIFKRNLYLDDKSFKERATKIDGDELDD